ncbi:hypothetical protein BRARA_H01697, partial [Brassica rapa]
SAYLHPEVSPLSPPTDLSPPLLRASPAPLVPEITKEAPLATNPVSLSPAVTAPALWVSKLKASTHNLKKLASPTFAADGTPVVRAPESVIFKSSNLWKDYIVAQFHGTPPSPTKIFSDLNPIWGKHGRIKVKQQSHDVCFILIPFSPWSPNMNLSPMKLEYAPVWVLFRNVPPELWSLEGFSTFATGVGFPVQSEFPNLKPYTNGVVKLKVIIKLEAKRQPSVKVVDKMGNSAIIYAEYLKLPPKCSLCSEFGHLNLRCPQLIAKKPSPSPKGNEALSVASVASRNERLMVSPAASQGSKSGKPSTANRSPIRRSSSLPSGSKLSGAKTAGEWIRVAHRSNPPLQFRRDPYLECPKTPS